MNSYRRKLWPDYSKDIVGFDAEKANYHKEMFVLRVKWPDEWGYIVPLYQETYDKITKGNKDFLPEKVTLVNRAIFASLEPKLEHRRPVPPPDTKMYGWKVGCSISESADKWTKTPPKISMYKQLGWSRDSQP